MLRQLHIQKLALVDELELNLDPGFNVLTGETGAGKSILVGALDLILGGRARPGAVREGAAEALVEALFELPEPMTEALSAQGFSIPEGELLVRRVIPRAGRARVYLNGQLATLRTLGILRQVLDLSSQHEHLSLLKPEQHLGLLDAFGGLESKVALVGRAHAEVQLRARALEALQVDEAERARREDYLQYALGELEALALVPGELAELEAERRRLGAAQSLIEGAREAEARLYSGEGAAVDQLGRVGRSLEQLAGLDPGLSGLSQALSGVLAELEEVARGLSSYHAGLEASPARLEQVDDRLAELRRVLRKYGGQEEALLSAWAELKEEREQREHGSERAEALTAALTEAEAQLSSAAARLSSARRAVVRRLERALVRELRELSLPKTRLAVQLTPLDAPGPRGAESVELRLSSNPGEPLLPLSRIASGGELSRVLIAVKRALSHRHAVGSYVFDEVDTGIGGAVADVVGAKLAQIGAQSQVLAVTHLAPVAAYATAHFRVEKRQRAGRTVTTVRRLTEGEQVEELARMLGGAEITARTRCLAEELRVAALGRPIAMAS